YHPVHNNKENERPSIAITQEFEDSTVSDSLFKDKKRTRALNTHRKNKNQKQDGKII
ncbi:unnamed protein product, partial [Didymodactylos carnosus]